MQGFNPAEVPSAYGDTLTFWDWRERKVTQSIKLGADGLIPLARPRVKLLLLLMVGTCPKMPQALRRARDGLA